MRLTFIGADHEVTGSCHYLQVGAVNILVDCGMEQGRNVFENVPLPVEPSKIQYVFLTHAHIDHSGMLPKLYHDGFRGQVVTTEATAELCDIMLRDSAHIQNAETEWKNKKLARRGSTERAEPLYTMEDTLALLRQLKPCRYGKRYQLCNGVEFRFTDIGHLLGSASLELWLTENRNGVAAGNPGGAPEGTVTKKIVFSGDIGNKNQPLLKDPSFTASADYVVMESTYGDRFHEPPQGNYEEELAGIIKATLLRGGNVIIPSFAIGRAQEMLYFIRKIKQNGLIPELPDFPVYLDSPLAVEATEIFRENGMACYDEEAMEYVRRGINPLLFPNLHMTISSDESKQINADTEPKVIISASGMCDAGRIKHHLKYNLWRPECTMLFVGYQSVGTPGRSIVDGAASIHIFGEEVQVRAEIRKLTGLSGHADKAGLLEWIGGFAEQRPRKVFVVHGDAESADAFARCLEEEHGFDAFAPYSGTVFNLAAGQFERVTEGIPAASGEGETPSLTGVPSPGRGRSAAHSDAYLRLKAAEQRLSEVVSRSGGLPNRELDCLAGELERLAEQYQTEREQKQEKRR
ncbi:MBL fold metallo-hydrolase RNA specificity domain-containing protein [Lachnoclostridium sp. Marseille-P6806]|uniref:MBL fold metallo-hydrolase RNA specificity domain-containing protein n=1 Tax=Lachnoclostridium sp. Marseille-P6806 TaxID=2364793 RepID=UPI00102F85FC|nr:MBL fold metallo-hydrolase [Lachnoclostridium sp. Marseille-P6806]